MECKLHHNEDVQKQVTCKKSQWWLNKFQELGSILQSQ